MEANPEALAPTVKAGVERVINSNKDYAFILESTMNEYFNQRRPCTTIKVGPNLDSGKGYGVATPPGSDLRDRLNLAVLELKEMDWIAQLYRLWWEERGECGKMDKSADKTSATSSLGLDSVYGLFYLLAGALVIGIFLAILEFIYRCAVNAKRTRRRFTEVFYEMLCQAIGKSEPHLGIPLMLYQPSVAKKAGRLDFYQDGEGEEVEEGEAGEEEGGDGGTMLSPPSPPPPSQGSRIETSYLNTVKWRTRRDAVPERIDYCL
uniref:Glutamate receptor 4 n=1 Tax=Echinococcus granulosus TaxID=6210 RepID=A0A068WUU0_ECHGR|nr:glutamate receptor 4 [Echinococcus granulosus]